MASPGDPVEVRAAGDPVAAWFAAEAGGRAVALRTSGTAAEPRRVIRSTASWRVHFDAVAELMGLTPASRVWVPGPLAATMNLYAAVHARAVGAGWGPDPAGATHAVLTPAALSRALRAGALAAGTHAVVAGDRLPGGLAARAAQADIGLSHYYGAAELSFVAWGPPGNLAPFPGVEVAERDGVLWARTSGLAAGYDRPGGPLVVDSDAWATVGDRGRVEFGPAGARVVVLGRDDAIVTGGATVLVAEVEEVLAAGLDGDVVVVGVPHAELGAIVGAAYTEPGDLDRIRASAAALEGPQRPRVLRTFESIPLTKAGKIDRAVIARRMAERTPT